MRIYSKFKDYYDGVGYYDATDRVWERKTKHYILNDLNAPVVTNNGFSKELNDFLMTAFNDLPLVRIAEPYNGNRIVKKYVYMRHCDFSIVIGFCGKLYIGAVHMESKNYRQYIVNVFNDYSEYMRSKFSVHPNIDICKNAYNRKPFTQEGFNSWHTQYQNHPKLSDIFVELKTPIFIVYPIKSSLCLNRASDYFDKNFVVNPCMKDWKLQNIFHSFIAYQEIDMYLSNDLAMCNYEELRRSDELIRDSKGFNDWSFKQKGPKKRKCK
jgi:hypothetical protein